MSTPSPFNTTTTTADPKDDNQNSTPKPPPGMKYVRLGKSGLKISPLILGCMGYGAPVTAPWVLSSEKSLPILHHAYLRGLNTWDTADFYSLGESERTIARAISTYKIPRQSLVLMTKLYFGVDESVVSEGGIIDAMKAMTNDGELVNRVGLSRKHIFDAVDASVERLGTYIDVLQIHRLDRDVEPEEIMKALNDVVESGKVRYLGASSMAAWEFQMLNNLAEKHGWHRFISMQNYHSLLYREEEREMLPYCKHAGVGVVPWSPLAGGVLARPWKADTDSIRAKNNQFASLLSDDTDKAVVDRLEEVAKKLGKSMATVAAAWSLKKGVNPILGLQTIERIDEALEAVSLELSEEDFKALEEPYKAKAVAPVF